MIGYRVMDLAWLRDGKVVHVDEALLLAVLLHAKGKTKRGRAEVEHVARLMTPNTKNPRR